MNVKFSPIIQLFDDFLISLCLEESASLSSTLLAWSIFDNNRINVIELNTMQNYSEFEGAQIKPSIFVLGA